MALRRHQPQITSTVVLWGQVEGDVPGLCCFLETNKYFVVVVVLTPKVLAGGFLGPLCKELSKHSQRIPVIVWPKCSQSTPKVLSKYSQKLPPKTRLHTV